MPFGVSLRETAKHHSEWQTPFAAEYTRSKNREQRIKDIQKKCEEFPDNESKSAYLYSFFSLKGTSKAEVAQHLSFILETKYASDPKALCERLPPYIRDAINYVTEQEDA